MSRGLPPEDDDTVESSRFRLAESEKRTSSVGILFGLTLASTFWVYGTQFMGQNMLAPFTDGAVAWESANCHGSDGHLAGA